MNRSTLIKAWKIWIIPWGLATIFVEINLVAYLLVRSHQMRAEHLSKIFEYSLAFVAPAVLLIAWYISMKNYEKVTKNIVPKRYRGYWRFFFAVYCISSILQIIM